MEHALVVGSGGREFALVEKLMHEGVVTCAAPGSDGIRRSLHTPSYQPPREIELNSDKGFEYLSQIAHYKRNPVIVIGSEELLASGVGDYLRSRNHLVFGPTEEMSRLETSKRESSDFMRRNGIPAPEYYNPVDDEDAMRYVTGKGFPLVIKGDGLARGKGVSIVQNIYDAREDLERKMIRGELGGPGVNIQDWIDIAYELSAVAIVDVRKSNGVFTGDYRLMPYSMDHKFRDDNDRGPMTGGMGAIAPIPISGRLKRKIKSEIIERTIEGLKRDKMEFTGCLYIALAVDKNDDVWTLEYNVRFPDPETQVILDVMDSDLYPYLMSASLGELGSTPEIKIRKGFSTMVIAVSRGYPEDPEIGFRIGGLDSNGQLMRNLNSSTIIHAGTRHSDVEGWVTSGGRVFGVISRGRTRKTSISHAYDDIWSTHFTGKRYRNDIGIKAAMLT